MKAVVDSGATMTCDCHLSAIEGARRVAFTGSGAAHHVGTALFDAACSEGAGAAGPFGVLQHQGALVSMASNPQTLQKQLDELLWQ